MSNPNLTFFCELKTEQMAELFADDSVIEDLVALKANVSLGLLDLSTERADVVRRLNEAGVPLTAWQLLPIEEGYWFNTNNIAYAVARYAEFKTWTAEHGLQWAGIGIDIEPDRAEMEGMAEGGWGSAAPKLLGRLFDNQRLRDALDGYGELVAQMQADGYVVESYHLPFVIDERKAGATLLQKVAGLVDVPTNREVLMLYSSFASALFGPELGPGFLWSYGPDSEAIGVGSTGGGVDTGGADQLPTLDWDAFTRDLKLAKRWTDHIYVFSLEGSVRQGFLKRLLEEFDWAGPVDPPLEAEQRVNVIRKIVQGVLWMSAHPKLVLGILGGLLWLLGRRRKSAQG